MKKINQLHNGNIRELKKRLEDLELTYNQLTKRIELERDFATNDEGAIEYQNLQDEKELIKKYMKRICRHIQKEEESNVKGDLSSVEPGVDVLIVNETHRLKFKLVKQVISGINNQISVKSPLGKAVLGKRVGDDIHVKTPNGIIHYEIKEIS